jgi:hypothetical protein
MNKSSLAKRMAYLIDQLDSNKLIDVERASIDYQRQSGRLWIEFRHVKRPQNVFVICAYQSHAGFSVRRYFDEDKESEPEELWSTNQDTAIINIAKRV